MGKTQLSFSSFEVDSTRRHVERRTRTNLHVLDRLPKLLFEILECLLVKVDLDHVLFETKTADERTKRRRE